MRTLLRDAAFIIRHKRAKQDFTRNRVLTFDVLFLIVFRKSMKSLQLMLNEFIPELALPAQTVSGAAFSKARKKILHTAFIELNHQAIVETTYADEYKTYKGLRILAIDGSKIQLPDTPEIKEAFGAITVRNQYDDVEGTYACALASVLYDTENNIAIHALFEPGKSSEIDCARKHLSHIREHDLIIFDRGYCAYRIMAFMAETKGDFLIRCHRNSFSIANDMLAGKGQDDVIVTLRRDSVLHKKYPDANLPKTLTVRFVRVLLDTGEYEVLATSLMDHNAFPTSDFKALYWKRWGIETFYGKAKTRLMLENFSGISAESVKQDFYATILLMGFESLLTEESDESLATKDTVHEQRVNKAVAFNAIKQRAFDLFLGDEPLENVLLELEVLFAKNPTLYREGREVPRRKINVHRILNFFRRKKKVVF